MRLVLVFIGALVFGTGLALYVLTAHTAHYFAWTIKPHLTAAFLGSGYWASAVLAFLASRERVWARARIAVPTAFLLSALLLAATFVHLDRFHLHGPTALAQVITWAWILTYAVVPPLMLVGLVAQLRAPGRDPVRELRLKQWVRLVAGSQSAVMLGLGIALYAAPRTVGDIWPWTLTPLTGRAVASWLVGVGLALAHVLWEDDWRRVRAGSIAYVVLAGLELIALARYSGDVDWNGPRVWVYLAFLVSVGAVGLYGWSAALPRRDAERVLERSAASSSRQQG
jgi:hypothetical protein